MSQQAKPLRLQRVRFKEDSAYWKKLTLYPAPVSQRMSHCKCAYEQTEREHGYGSVLTYMALKVLLEKGFVGAGVAPFLQEPQPHCKSNESLQRSHPKMAYEHLQVDARRRQSIARRGGCAALCHYQVPTAW